MSCEDAWRNRERGDAKLFLTFHALQVRREHFEAFAPGAGFEGLKIHDSQQGAAWMRGGRVIAIAPLRSATSMLRESATLQLPDGNWVDRFTGGSFEGVVNLGEALGRFPVALLVRE